MDKDVKIVKELKSLALEQFTKGLQDIDSIELADPSNAIPIEQLKGDIARQGHPVMRVLALDPDAGRMFFQDMQDNALFAEFAGSDQGYRILRIGFQSEVQSEYKVTDLQKADWDATDMKDGDVAPGFKAEQEHDEEDWDRDPGQAGPTPNPGTIDDVRDKAIASLKKIIGR